ncbi:MAG: hypothetical protein WC700_09115 [Gemmatimonadaceae bacterium]|jgi:hypothetical protein
MSDAPPSSAFARCVEQLLRAERTGVVMPLEPLDGWAELTAAEQDIVTTLAQAVQGSRVMVEPWPYGQHTVAQAGRLGGLKGGAAGGAARMAGLTGPERSDLARHAASKRWGRENHP